MSAPNLTGRIMAIDYGARYIGLAVSDEMRLTARPLKTFERKNWKTTIKILKEIVETLDVAMILFGLPLKLDGSDSAAALEMRRVIDKLQLTLKMPVVPHNEALTTFAAQTQHSFANLEKFGLDALAAYELLNDYLNLKQ